ncbi:MAG TPA: cation diffusion facilitator family transporter [Solirubrobacterales bacterium]|nr:cation diffusion facilitator family transporter [Solirubrobacterales bacterium]
MSHLHAAGRGPAKRALKLVLPLIFTFTVVEVVAGFLAGSLALLADAAHMLSDNLAIGLALFAIWIAERPATSRQTFGFKRAEILAALVNGFALVVVSLWIFYEAYRRLGDEPEVLGGWMLAVACVGLAVNAAAIAILNRSRGESLNVSAAFRHLLADLLGSIGVIVAAVVILTTGWQYADPVAGAAIGVLVLASSWTILRDSVQVLLEGAPRGLDVDEVGRAMAATEGVVEVHDLHVWTITSGFPALAAHVIVGRDEDCHAKRRELERLLDARFGLEHTTLQVDHAGPDLLQLEPSD